MHPLVAAAWPREITRYEGRISFMYLDTKKLVTTGIGNLIDSGTSTAPASALVLPWRDAAGRWVSEAKVAAEWKSIKSHTELAPKGGAAFDSVATLSLADADIDHLVGQRIAEFEGVLTGHLPKLAKWPADAQLALFQMAWLLGPNFLGPGWPNFTAAAKAANFAKCAEHCSTASPSARNRANIRLFGNAARVKFAGLQRPKLWLTGVPRHPLGGDALLTLPPTIAEPVPAWYVQRMLKVAGHYTGTLDGDFGSVSRDAFVAWAAAAGQPGQVTPATLNQLSRQTIKMPLA